MIVHILLDNEARLGACSTARRTTNRRKISLHRDGLRTKRTQQEAGYPEIADLLVVSASRLEVSPREVCLSTTCNNKAREYEHNLLHLCVFNDVTARHLLYGFLGRGETAGAHS